MAPIILALDTATSEVAVGLYGRGGERVSVRVPAGRRAGSVLPPLVAEVVRAAGLRPLELDVIAVGVGPGPYTSLRAGVMFGRAAALAAGAEVVGACTLDAIALTLRQQGLAEEAVVATDARRREVYWARYGADGTRVAGPLVGRPAEVADANADALWCGPGVGAAPAPDAGVLAEWVARSWPPAELGRVGGAWDAAGGSGAAAGAVPQALLRPEPLYLRRPDAAEPVALGSPL